MTIVKQIPENVFGDLLAASNTKDVDAVLARLPVVNPDDYQLDYKGPVGKWRDNHLHWLPVGRERGNGGRIKLAGQPTNPIAERLVNGMEAVIEHARLKELRSNPQAQIPQNPREAVLRYFGLPRLDSIPRISDTSQHFKLIENINQVRQKLSVKLLYEKKSREFGVAIRDVGMGQEPHLVHKTLLSLGQTDKADKPYMIGVFGQGGSSAFAASEVSTIISRRAPDLLMHGGDDGVGWTIVRQIFPKGRRDNYFAYLAMTPGGEVPKFNAAVADAAGFAHGSCFTHIKYDFGGYGGAVARMLYQALNHVLFNPILPYELYTIEKERPELMQGTAQRLARRVVQLSREKGLEKHSELDKSFSAQLVGGRA